MTFTTATELYTALTGATKHENIGPYMLNRKHTQDRLTSEDGLNFIHTKMTMCETGGKQRKIPCYLTQSKNDLKFSVWGKFECDNHTDYLDTTQQNYKDRPMMDNCDFFIILLNNTTVEKEFYAVIDIDSEKELFDLYKRGFPVFDTPFTLSASKQLPHFWVRTTGTQQILGDKLNRDFDLITNYIFERKTNTVYGSPDVPFVSHDDLSKYLDIPLDLFRSPKSYDTRKEAVIYSLNKVPARPDFCEKRQRHIVDVGSKRFHPDGEVIPYFTLVRIFDALPVAEYSTRSKWLCVVRATINMITPTCNPNDYLNLINTFYQNAPNYNQHFPQENAEVFSKFLNDNSYTGIGAEWFFKQLLQHNPELHTELAFSPDRDMDTRNFGKLSSKDAVKVFNERVAFIDGNICQFVEYNATTGQFFFRSEKDLNCAYRNLHCQAVVVKYTPDGQEIKKVKKEKFIKMWLEDEDRRTFRGGVCFKPTPLRCPHNQFNLFTGFAIDQVKDYDEEVGKLTKEELEDRLSFILQHLRYLSGEDKTDQCFDFNLKYFAHLIKFPAILPRVSLVWTSVAGVGKNQWLNFHENIIGKQYYYSSANSKELLGDFNDCIRGKLLLNLNEFKKTTDFMEAIKELTTEETVSVREKHKNAMRVDNCARTIITTNNRPQILEFKARRFQVNRCSPYPASDEMRYDRRYGHHLHTNITDLYIQKCWVRYCREFVPVGRDYNFETARVITDEYLMLRSRNIPAILRFLRYWYVGTTDDDNHNSTARDMYDLYKHWCNEEGEPRNFSQSEFINALEVHTIRQDTKAYLQANIDAVIVMPKGKKQKVFRLNRDRCRDFLDSENIDTSIFLASSDDDEYGTDDD